jgi:hypothetical protein
VTRAYIFGESLSMLVNGIPTEHINFRKGLKQGYALASVLVISKELQLEISTYRCLICNLWMVLFSYGRLVWRICGGLGYSKELKLENSAFVCLI